MPLEEDAVNRSAGVWVLGIFQGYKMFSLHLPKLMAAVTEHVPLENHKRADCQALWTEACQGLVSVKGRCCVGAGEAALQVGLGRVTAQDRAPRQQGWGQARRCRHSRTASCRAAWQSQPCARTARLPSEKHIYF